MINVQVSHKQGNIRTEDPARPQKPAGAINRTIIGCHVFACLEERNNMADSKTFLQKEHDFLTHNYHPLPVVLHKAEGVWVEDVDGKRYMDCLAGYSSLNFGHANQRILDAATKQMQVLAMTSRAFCTDQLGPFAEELTKLAKMDMMLPMNTGAEAVEGAIKISRAWGYRVKGVAPEKANIIVMSGNFHGRTTTIVSFSDDPQARDDFGPFTPGFRMATFGDAQSAIDLIDENTVAILTEPIQGEGGVIIPPADFLPRLRKACDENNVLLVVDEIQAGLGRTGYTFSCDLLGVKPDLMTLGKALGGGIYPVSAVVGRKDVMEVLNPGEHGSTFGGNPLAAAIGREVIKIISEGTYQENAKVRGAEIAKRLEKLVGNGVATFRAVGLWIGVDIDPSVGTARDVCERLMDKGVLAKDTHGKTVRLCPPLCITAEEASHLMDVFEETIAELRQ